MASSAGASTSAIEARYLAPPGEGGDPLSDLRGRWSASRARSTREHAAEPPGGPGALQAVPLDHREPSCRWTTPNGARPRRARSGRTRSSSTPGDGVELGPKGMDASVSTPKGRSACGAHLRHGGPARPTLDHGGGSRSEQEELRRGLRVEREDLRPILRILEPGNRSRPHTALLLQGGKGIAVFRAEKPMSLSSRVQRVAPGPGKYRKRSIYEIHRNG